MGHKDAPGRPVLDCGLLSHKVVNSCSFMPCSLGVTCFCSQDSQKATSVADPQGLWGELVFPLEDCSLEQSQPPILDHCPRLDLLHCLLFDLSVEIKFTT